MCLMHAVFGNQNFRNEIVWDYRKVSNSELIESSRAHDTVIFNSKSTQFVFNALFESTLFPRNQELVNKG